MINVLSYFDPKDQGHVASRGLACHRYKDNRVPFPGCVMAETGGRHQSCSSQHHNNNADTVVRGQALGLYFNSSTIQFNSLCYNKTINYVIMSRIPECPHEVMTRLRCETRGQY